MGRKVHPMSFRLGVTNDWQARWYADKSYAEYLREDLKLRKAINTKYLDAGIAQVEIERQANEVTITIHTARPGIVIGRGGQRVDEMRAYLEHLIGKKIRVNIREIGQPELNAFLVAKAVADQLSHRIAHRRAMKQAIFRTMQAGCKGIRIRCAGRLGGTEIARQETMHQGRVPLHTIRADIDYGFTEARTALGRIGVKVWLYKGDILPERDEMEIEEMPEEAVSEAQEAVAAAEPAAPTPAAGLEIAVTAAEEAEIPAAAAEITAEEAEIPAAAAEITAEAAEIPAAKARVAAKTKKPAAAPKPPAAKTAEATTEKPAKTKKSTVAKTANVSAEETEKPTAKARVAAKTKKPVAAPKPRAAKTARAATEKPAKTKKSTVAKTANVSAKEAEKPAAAGTESEQG